MSRRAAEYKRTSLSGEERKARLKQRCMEDVAAKRSKLIRSLRNAPGSVSQVGHSIVEAMQSEAEAPVSATQPTRIGWARCHITARTRDLKNKTRR